MAIKEVSTTWSTSRYDTFVRCPVEGCTHTASIITKAHLRLERGLTKEEAQQKFGYPQNVQIAGFVSAKTNIERSKLYYSTETEEWK